MMESGTPIMHICEKLKCYNGVAKRSGVELGFLLEEQLPKKNAGSCYEQRSTIEAEPETSLRDHYREQWLQAIKDNPEFSRSFLMKHYPEAHKWLRENDVDWYEDNSPDSKRHVIVDWIGNDDVILEKARNAVTCIKNLPGSPVWITLSSVEKYGGLGNFRKNLKNGNLPKTQEYLNVMLESRDEWRKRKIIWAIKELHNENKSLHLQQIRIKASVSNECFAQHEDYARDYIAQLNK